MKRLTLIMSLLVASAAPAVLYETHEIRQAALDSQLRQLSIDYQQAYFTAKDPGQVVDDLLAANLIPLHKEAILFDLLTSISQQPPQDYHQYLVDLMKTHQAKANRMAEEGHLPVAIYNLSSKAHGIENIWLAYRSEQAYSQLLSRDPDQAISTFRAVIAEQQRPKWLAVKNSLAAADPKTLDRLADKLLNEVTINQGLDPLISHLGLQLADLALINKALASDNQTVREHTLRFLPQHVSDQQARNLLLKHADQGPDQVFSTSLLSTFAADPQVELSLLNKLNTPETAAAAAFALGQSQSPGLVDRLFKAHQKTASQVTRDHILLSLRLHHSETAAIRLKQLQSGGRP
jgi:hypothetical protein